MAEGVKTPEKNAGFWRFGPPIGGGGCSLAKKNKLHCATTHTAFLRLPRRLSGGPLDNEYSNGLGVHNSFEYRHLH
jgi:hypothetical protein